MQNEKLLGLPFLLGTRNEINSFLIDCVNNKNHSIILPTSLNDLASIDNNFVLKSVYKVVDYCVTDGMPLVFYFNMKHKTNKFERLYGPYLMEDIIKNQNLDFRHFFYGSSEKTILMLKKYIKKNNSSLKSVGMISPPFRRLTKKEEAQYIYLIKKSGANILWVGLSSPKQVVLAARWKKFLPNTTIFCVGAAFDFLSGKAKIAPAWMQKIGLEWFYRLITNPRRLWKRYLIIIPSFLFKKVIYFFSI